MSKTEILERWVNEALAEYERGRAKAALTCLNSAWRLVARCGARSEQIADCLAMARAAAEMAAGNSTGENVLAAQQHCWSALEEIAIELEPQPEPLKPSSLFRLEAEPHRQFEPPPKRKLFGRRS
jgi:hypothetical protein